MRNATAANAEQILDTATRLIELHVEAFICGLAEQLGAVVTSAHERDRRPMLSSRVVAGGPGRRHIVGGNAIRGCSEQ
jgi:hypothetical protein